MLARASCSLGNLDRELVAQHPSAGSRGGKGAGMVSYSPIRPGYLSFSCLVGNKHLRRQDRLQRRIDLICGDVSFMFYFALVQS